MLPGFNHNINHQGVLFHVQTEDKGTNNPIVVTQLFVDGNVLATRRSSYDKFLNKQGVQEITLAMMQEQHKAMMKDLIHGRIKAVTEYIAKNPAAEAPIAAIVADTFPIKPKESVTAPAAGSDKTLDELILEFLSTSDGKK